MTLATSQVMALGLAEDAFRAPAPARACPRFEVPNVAVESYTYSAYGEVTISNGGTSVEQPFMFTGRRLDFEEGSGLLYYRNRYYDPEAGRFISRDPIGMWGDEGNWGNGQIYCGGNPVNWVDPMGRMSERTLRELERLVELDPSDARAAADLIKELKRGLTASELDEFDELVKALDAVEGAERKAAAALAEEKRWRELLMADGVERTNLDAKTRADFREALRNKKWRLDDARKRVKEALEAAQEVAGRLLRGHLARCARGAIRVRLLRSPALRTLARRLGPLGLIVTITLFAQNAEAKGLGTALLEEACEQNTIAAPLKAWDETFGGREWFPTPTPTGGRRGYTEGIADPYSQPRDQHPWGNPGGSGGYLPPLPR